MWEKGNWEKLKCAKRPSFGESHADFAAIRESAIGDDTNPLRRVGQSDQWAGDNCVCRRGDERRRGFCEIGSTGGNHEQVQEIIGSHL